MSARVKRRPNAEGSAVRSKTFSVTVTPEEYELFLQAASLGGMSGSAWARDILVSHGLRARWKGQAA